MLYIQPRNAVTRATHCLFWECATLSPHGSPMCHLCHHGSPMCHPLPPRLTHVPPSHPCATLATTAHPCTALVFPKNKEEKKLKLKLKLKLLDGGAGTKNKRAAAGPSVCLVHCQFVPPFIRGVTSLLVFFFLFCSININMCSQSVVKSARLRSSARVICTRGHQIGTRASDWHCHVDHLNPHLLDAVQDLLLVPGEVHTHPSHITVSKGKRKPKYESLVT